MLEIYLKQEWFIRNHKKYHKYFKQWFNNLTVNQTIYFEKDMNKKQQL